MLSILLALTLMPSGDASVEAAHDLGVDEHLRGRVFAQVGPDVVAGDGWKLRLEIGLETWFRENRREETRVRLSPEQIRYPVSARLRFDLTPGWRWGVFAFHQSNHDVDLNDKTLNTETLAYEVYGAELLMATDATFWAGMVYDRGTTLTGKRQSWPFDYGLAAVHADGRFSLWGPLDTSGALTLTFHKDGETRPAHVRVEAQVDVGGRFEGRIGAIRPYLRGQRVEDYQHLSDTPRYVLMLGLSITVATPD